MSSAVRNALKKAIHPLFKYREIRPDVFWIEEKYFDSWNKANIFFIRGKEKNLLIDTGKRELGLS